MRSVEPLRREVVDRCGSRSGHVLVVPVRALALTKFASLKFQKQESGANYLPLNLYISKAAVAMLMRPLRVACMHSTF